MVITTNISYCILVAIDSKSQLTDMYGDFSLSEINIVREYTLGLLDPH